MDVSMIVEIISSVGFPIAAVIAMGLFILKIYKSSEAREATLMEEIKENRRINADAIATIGHYAERLDSIQEDIKEIKTDITAIKAKP
jgi:chromosome segregation ATPase